MKAKNQFQKYKYYLVKRKEIFFHGLKKSQLLGRKTGPKVILNSLPKSGTHLLETLFFQLPLMRHCGAKTLQIELQNPIEKKLKTISNLKKGQFLLAHMQFHQSIIDTAKRNDTKIIHLIRDPRDVILSHLNYIENMDTTQSSHKYIKQFGSRLEKLEAIVEGKENILEPFPEVLRKFSPWLDNEAVLSIKFEDLIGPNGGGDRAKQIHAVRDIVTFLNIEIEEEQLLEVCNHIYSPKSSTFNKGKIGNWKQVLNEQEQDWLNNIIKSEISTYQYSLK